MTAFSHSLSHFVLELHLKSRLGWLKKLQGSNFHQGEGEEKDEEDERKYSNEIILVYFPKILWIRK